MTERLHVPLPLVTPPAPGPGAPAYVAGHAGGPPVSGWLLDATPALLALDAPGGGLTLVDDRGQGLARLDPASAAVVRRRLGGEALALPAALALALRQAPGLEEALARPAHRLTPPDLLRRGRWQQLFVELTATCNERCRHCYAGSGPERREALDRATAEAVVREAAALGFEVVQFTGGEALLCPFLAELCQQARAAGVPVVEVYTNGVLLTAARYAPLRAAGVAFAFSLYGRDAAVHDAVTRLPGSHARTVAALRRAVEGGSEVRVGVVATRPEDEAQALAAAELARELGVQRVGVQVARAVGRGTYAGRAAPTAAPGTGDARAASEGDPAHGDPAHGDPAHGDPAHGDPTHGHLPAPPGRAPGGKAAVLPDGDVVPCIFSRELRLGRVGPQGGLRAALERPAARLAGATEVTEGGCARRALGELEASLTCGECRLVAGLLQQAPS